MPPRVTSEASALVLAISVTAVGLLLTADSVEMCRNLEKPAKLTELQRKIKELNVYNLADNQGTI